MNTFTKLLHHIDSVHNALNAVQVAEVEKAVRILERARKEDSFVWIVGNGGSAATASHFANDLAKVDYIRAISVPDQTAMVTAFGNDEGWEKMYSKTMGRNSRGNDVLIAISCSGNSPNIVYTASRNATKDHLIVLTGPARDSKLAQVGAGAVIHAEAEDIKVQEDVHLAVCHAIVGALLP